MKFPDLHPSGLGSAPRETSRENPFFVTTGRPSLGTLCLALVQWNKGAHGSVGESHLEHQGRLSGGGATGGWSRTRWPPSPNFLPSSLIFSLHPYWFYLLVSRLPTLNQDRGGFKLPYYLASSLSLHPLPASNDGLSLFLIPVYDLCLMQASSSSL
jgi:hypothetical protein